MKTGQMRTPQGRELSKQVSPEEGTRWELPKSSLSLAHPGLASTQLDAQANILNVRLFGAGVRGMPADRTHGPEELRSGLHSKQTNKKNTFWKIWPGRWEGLPMPISAPAAIPSQSRGCLPPKSSSSTPLFKSTLSRQTSARLITPCVNGALYFQLMRNELPYANRTSYFQPIRSKL